MRLGRAILATAKVLVGSVLLMLFVNPANYTSASQAAILAEYKAVYCMPVEEARKDPVRHSTRAALMSRISIEGGLGPLAWWEYTKCKVF